MKTINLFTAFFLLSIFIISCQGSKQENKDSPSANKETSSSEKYRPNYHFTPKKGWMNDPNGMFYLDGTYHLFFQHNPDSTVWGPMHWGHATSEDLINWDEKPIALEPDEKGHIFSGSGVVDKDNTSKLGDKESLPVIAVFTYHDMEAEKAGADDYETQGIAYSLDQGKTFTKYKDNPVLENQGKRDFRDPKVRWSNRYKKWVMTIAADDEIQFYESPDLKDWSYLSSFGKEHGDHGGVWETPDLFPLEDDNGKEKWVLLVSINPGGPNGGSATQYFTGTFDGDKFNADDADKYLDEEQPNWIDYGRDNYAGVTWSNALDQKNKRVFIGWMSNWDYANEVPTEKWRSTSTIPREIKLEKVEEDYKIVSQPISLEDHSETKVDKPRINVSNKSIVGGDSLDLERAHIKFDLEIEQEDSYDFALTNQVGDTLKFGYQTDENEFYLDRKSSGEIDFSENFADKVSKAPRLSDKETLSVELLLDKTSIELFYDNGKTVMTEIFFPTEPYTEFLYLNSGKLENLKLNQMQTE